MKFNDNYHDDCVREDELADVVYLRSGDKNKAFGVITNRRANYYTLGEGECIQNTLDIPKPTNEGLQTYGNVEPEGGNNRIRIRNMKLGKEYKIKYYSPYDLVNSIKEETRWGPKLTLEFPDLDTLDILLFEAFPLGGNFKSMLSDTTDSKEILTRESKKEKGDEVIVYPNPNDGDFNILIENFNGVLAIYITNNLGKEVDVRTQIFYENQYDNKSFNSGVYIVKVVYKDKIIRKKLIIN